MKMFRVFQTPAPEAPRIEDHALQVSHTSVQVPPQQRIDAEPTKADEMIRLMAERRDRHKRIW